MDESRAILHLSTRFPNKSREYLVRKYYQCDGHLNATIAAITNDESEEVSLCNRFLDSLFTCIGNLFCCWDGPSYTEFQERSRNERQYPSQVITTPIISPSAPKGATRRVFQELPQVHQVTTNAGSARHSATFYREQAQQHLEKKRELNRIAHQYKQGGKYKLANEYFEAAKKQKQQHEEANRRAAAAFLKENYEKNPSNDTIDFHHLYVKEAVEVLDIFLDDQIGGLRDDNVKTKALSVITGRGKHSENGVPKIKPAVIERLIVRKLKFSEVNAGHLKVYIYKNSLLTNDLS
ncbi:NEDD4-binding protein 2-like [Tribolium madens]|uniref:NEDD4-binding protein 2-like n=1 Tax=Tribolium madens TaxID=41895 RepID=UPI001CF72CD8|nr:NEDD4-binding protein 2-like [Tribolium madens]XP_044267377.1 NEDD4-binding protein 2-like [Tribolium madens]XP_044267378.1 NEDD4-binding protein 2-like [Tribolium madens]XP_044267379.1 NEDD4-binding protein 2-like [Tribolium madens]